MELQFNQVQQMLHERLDIDPERTTAFRGRIQHLRKMGFPSGVNTGRGRKAVYGWPQLFDLVVAFDLIDAGISPDLAVHFVSTQRLDILAGLKERGPLHDMDRLGILICEFQALSDLKRATPKTEIRTSFTSLNHLRTKLVNKDDIPGNASVILYIDKIFDFLVKRLSKLTGHSESEVSDQFYSWIHYEIKQKKRTTNV